MKRFILSPEARQDLHTIRNYYLKEAGPRVAKYVLTEIDRGFHLVANTPGAGHSRTDLTASPVKFWSVFSYFIIYDFAAHPVGIVRILHSSRDVESILRG